jgi:HD superfamily phosphodiesterase
MNVEQAEAFITSLLRDKLPVELYYHNLRHTLNVARSAGELAELEGVSVKRERDLLRTAALFHDSGFLVNYPNHEAEGCNLARLHLPGFGYAPGDIDAICRMILATRMPQSPESLLEKILCDADLDYLGRDDFDAISEALLAEWQARGKSYTAEAWNKLQVDFLKSHRYWTASAARRREAKKREHLRRIEARLA